MKQKFFLTMLLLLAAITATAYDFESGGIYYNINGTKVTVTSSPSTNKYSGDVTIPESVIYNGVNYAVTTIGNSAFYNCSGLTNVTIPNSVTSIQDYAFKYCSRLTSITIPSSITSIGENVFGSCTGLASITVDSGNRKFDSRDNCNAIIKKSGNTLVVGCKNTIIPNTVTKIGEDAFDGCSGLTSITIPNSVTSIGSWAFNWCRALTEVTIPNSVTVIGSYAFHLCDRLTTVTIGNSVKTISYDAFEGCSSLTSITIPSSVTNIGQWAFRSCSGLTSMTVESGNTKYDSRDNCNAIIETASNTLLSGCMNTVIPNSVTAIASYSFSSCSGLTSVNIPGSVNFIGSSAFWNCKGLTDVYSYITDLSVVSFEDRLFDLMNSNDYSHRTLHVPSGTAVDYRENSLWGPYFGTIVEMEPIVVIPGDIDGDGELHIGDVTDLINLILGGNATVEDCPAADVNGDGNINITDVTDLINLILTAP